MESSRTCQHHRPVSLSVLERRMGAYADSTQQQAGRIRVTIGQVVVAQLLPGALVKGRSGATLRLGQEFARGSKDLVVAWCDAQFRFGDALRPSLPRSGMGSLSWSVACQEPSPARPCGQGVVSQRSARRAAN